MKKLIHICFILLFVQASGNAQFFRATMTASGNDLVFSITPNPGGGNITCGWSDIELFVRYASSAPSFSFGTITVNNVHFPGIVISYNGLNAQGDESGYVNAWFGRSFTGTTAQTYMDGLQYEVFRTTLSINPFSVTGLELVANEPNFSPHYLVLTDQNSGERTARVDGTILFYGPDAAICNPNCPVTTPGNNHIKPLSAPLPVELIDFAARPLNATDALLNWETASEINSSHFEIERSLDGKTWKYVGQELAAGQSHIALNYESVDEKVHALDSPNNLYYYRLKMVDLDGSFTYSQIVSVSFESTNSIRIYPNPFSSSFQVEIASNQEGGLSAQMFDVTGRRVWQGELQTGIQELEQSNLQSGIYWMEVDLGNRMERARVVKN